MTSPFATDWFQNCQMLQVLLVYTMSQRCCFGLCLPLDALLDPLPV